MSLFNPGEIEYLQKQTMCRLATVGQDGQPHVIPLTFTFNAEEDAIDIDGIDFASGKAWRDAQHDAHITVLADDASPAGARAVEVRGTAEIHEKGGSRISPRFPNVVEQFIRLRPHYVVSWGVDNADTSPGEFRPYGRKVG